MRALLARDCADRMLDREVSVADACSRAIERGILQARRAAASAGPLGRQRPRSLGMHSDATDSAIVMACGAAGGDCQGPFCVM